MKKSFVPVGDRTVKSIWKKHFGTLSRPQARSDTRLGEVSGVRNAISLAAIGHALLHDINEKHRNGL